MHGPQEVKTYYLDLRNGVDFIRKNNYNKKVWTSKVY